MNIVLGSAQFGLDYGVTNQNGKILFKEICKILLESLKSKKVWCIDTSTQYGNSEQIIGKATSEINHNFNIVTKTKSFKGINSKTAIETLLSDFDNSLTLLKRNKIYALLFHSADDLCTDGADELFNTARKLKEQHGFKLGVSVYTPQQLELIMSRYSIDIAQLPLNIFDQRFIPLLDTLKNKNIEVHSRSTFLQGLLLNNDNLPKSLQKYQNIFSNYNEIINQHKYSPLEASLAFSSAYSENLVLGVTSCSELKEIIEVDKLFNKKLLEELNPFKEIPSDIIDPRRWKP